MRSSIERKAFKTGLIIKLVDGCLELAGALVVWLVQPATVDRIARFFTDDALADDPNAVLANYIVGLAHSYSSVGARAFVALYLLAHGVVKVAMVIALLRRHRWAYPALLASLSLFILYQTYRLVRRLSLGLIVLTLFDVAIVWLVWRDYRRARESWRADATSTVLTATSSDRRDDDERRGGSRRFQTIPNQASTRSE
jgi:uncharacterized membrane protein